ncbi:hypothetical protein Q7P37_003537 [Cladosporium fusiforme]
MQHAGAAQEPSQDVDMADYNQKVKEIRDRFFGQRPQETPSQSYPPQAPDHAHASDQQQQTSGSASPHGNLDSNVTGPHQSSYRAMSNDTAGDDNLSAEARKSKRELSTSKRAAQNRAAQRAFRQRKEGYIRELEEKVKQFESMENDFRGLQEENHQLREYILNLQSQLLEHNKETSSSSPPPSRKRVANREGATFEKDHGQEMQRQSAQLPPVSGAPNPSRQEGAAPEKDQSWSDHIDALRQRYSSYGLAADYSSLRSSADGDTTHAADGKSPAAQG